KRPRLSIACTICWLVSFPNWPPSPRMSPRAGFSNCSPPWLSEGNTLLCPMHAGRVPRFGDWRDSVLRLRRIGMIEAVERPAVVQDLILRTGLPNVVVFLIRAVDDAAISARSHLPLQRELEVVIGSDGDNITRRLT